MDGIDELLFEEVPQDGPRPSTGFGLLAHKAGPIPRFGLESEVFLPSDTPIPDSMRAMGDTDGRPGDEVVLLAQSAAREPGFGRVRISLRDGDTTRFSWPISSWRTSSP